MKFKKLVTLAITSLVAIGAVGCKSQTTGTEDKDDKTIVVGASATPHAEILEHIKPALEKEGYKLEVKVFNDYVLPNTGLSEGSLDANYFQHVPYLEETIKEKGYKLTYITKVHIEPIGLYSQKIKNVSELKDKDTVAIPQDPTNGGRALKLLADNGIIKVKEGVELLTVNDITENTKNLQFKALDAEQLPSALPDVAAAIINTNYALAANLNPLNDAIILESKDSPYANILAVREEDKDSEKLKALAAALNTDDVKTFIQEKYKGAIIPAF
ncbi:MAG: MetQ/NlpA family ABC transporter substrate-binding protein [Clostridioides sp.]|jgi:D-methionine transport system substrate-binding protein|nr:MetQ/NlpA family ABC transporter substrate-binding protein [Clostridioides sp.]